MHCCGALGLFDDVIPIVFNVAIDADKMKTHQVNAEHTVKQVREKSTHVERRVLWRLSQIAFGTLCARVVVVVNHTVLLENVSHRVH